jgi:formylglycine-generating enzyme required for sulfatase activity
MSKGFAAIGVICLMIQADAGQRQVCPSSPAAGSSCTVGGVEFVASPAGEFAMGDSSDLASPNEQPVHDVALDAFWMAKTELTFKQWNAFLIATGHPRGRSSARSDDHPVVSVTWEDAKAYCDWITKTTGGVVRLPSEAEWEYAARGGLRGRPYPNGDSMSPREANYASNGSVKVGSYPPNGYGLHDMAGNVFEWVGGWYDRNITVVRRVETLAGRRPKAACLSGQPTAAVDGAWASTRFVLPLDMPVLERGMKAARAIALGFDR